MKASTIHRIRELCEVKVREVENLMIALAAQKAREPHFTAGERAALADDLCAEIIGLLAADERIHL